MMSLKFYRCRHCGNVVVKFVDSGVRVMCCGSVMEELHPEMDDEYQEKHVPVVSKINENSVEVRVGSVLHPMTMQHFIQFIAVETKDGVDMKWLYPDMNPSAVFHVSSPIVAVYAYCNMHGLWKTKQEEVSKK